ncbi:MAG: hypothetical protein K2W94_09270 [Alphaproteobacteria bacterium]|nr:hypothetical protein [Alphaproteobacteria bacterium]
MPIARALVPEKDSKVQKRKDELGGSSAYDSTLSDLERELRTAESQVSSLESRLENNSRWIAGLRASFDARDNFRGFHGAFMNQYHALQTPKVWESSKLDELETLRQSLTDLSMLVEELQGFYKDVHQEVVKVAAKEGRVFDMRHTPSMIADKDAGHKQVLLPVSPPSLALTDGSVSSGGSGMDGALVGMPQAGISATWLKYFADGSGMSNPLKHFADVEKMVEKTKIDTATHATVVERVRAQAESVKSDRARMKAAATVVEVRNPLVELNLDSMSLPQVKNVLGVTNSIKRPLISTFISLLTLSRH